MAITAPRALQLRLFIKPSLGLSGTTVGYVRLSTLPGLPDKPPSHIRHFTAVAARARASPSGPLRSSHAFPQPVITPGAFGHESEPAAEPNVPEYDLSCLPLASLLRNLLTSTISSHPLLLTPALRLLSKIAYCDNPLLSPSHNPLIHFVLKNTLYAQFCAGETPREVQATIRGLKQWGIQGVLLGWAREVEERCGRTVAASRGAAESDADKIQINEWIAGVRETIGLVDAGDVVSIKLTGAGELNLQHLHTAAPPSPTLAAGLTELCDLARSRGVTIVIDAEQISLQPGIESWTLNLQRRYNRDAGVVVGTYQAYLRKTAALLAQELAVAEKEGFVLGVKLVRGAYLGSDPRDSIQPSKEDTDAAYDGLAAAIIRSEWSAALQPRENAAIDSPFPRTRLILATHNAVSAQKGLDLQRNATASTPPIVHAQLMGMADHVSCSLVRARKKALARLDATHEQMVTAEAKGGKVSRDDPPWVPRPYKYLVWGTMDECLKYLVRRGEENRDAVSRTEEGRKLLVGELRRRMSRVFGL
jgi:proline dehydrogenase